MRRKMKRCENCMGQNKRVKEIVNGSGLELARNSQLSQCLSLAAPRNYRGKSLCFKKANLGIVSSLMGLEEKEAWKAFVKKTHKYIR